jgi:hypothetical protein
MKPQQPRLTARERYRALVSFLIIPLGLVIVIRSSMLGWQAWTLIVMGLAFMGLGIVRLRSFARVSAFGERK